MRNRTEDDYQTIVVKALRPVCPAAVFVVSAAAAAVAVTATAPGDAGAPSDGLAELSCLALPPAETVAALGEQMIAAPRRASQAVVAVDGAVDTVAAGVFVVVGRGDAAAPVIVSAVRTVCAPARCLRLPAPLWDRCKG